MFTRVLFEPWSMGDALIAAAVLRETGSDTALMCDSKWHPVILGALGIDSKRLLAVSLPYTARGKSKVDILSRDLVGLPDLKGIREVLSIRGDIRDLIAAKKLFPNARVKMTGWLGFLARRLRLLDLLFSTGILQVNNRYRSWASLVGIPFSLLEERRAHIAHDKKLRKIVIHLGAQWRSKQYPWVSSVKEECEKKEFSVELIAGPRDALPGGIDSKDVRRLVDQDVIEAFRSASLVVTNDSGPMHLASLLGCRTLAIQRTSNPAEWGPPGVEQVLSSQTPRGYHPAHSYNSDQVLLGWVEPSEVVHRILNLLELAQLDSAKHDVSIKSILYGV